MNVRDLVTFICKCPDIKTHIHEPQKVLIVIDGKEFELVDIFSRGDNKLILSAEGKK